MIDETITSFLFTLHFMLFLVKAWAVSFTFSLFIFATSQKNRKMVIFKYSALALLMFNIMIVIAEIWYLSTFFVEIDLFYYDYLSILDQIVFTLVGIIYFIKEGKQ